MSRRWVIRIGVLVVFALLAGSLAFHEFVILARERDLLALQDRLGRRGGSLFLLDHREGILNWIGRTIGRDRSLKYLGSPGARVTWNGSTAAKDELALLLAGPPLRQVFLGGSRNLDDDWIGGIHHPRSLIQLNIGGTGVTDRSIPKILEMTNLDSLDLTATAVSDEGIERLKTLPKLRGAYVGGPNVRAFQLVEAGLFDGSDRPASHAGSLFKVRGRVRSVQPFVPGSFVDVMVRTAKDAPIGHHRSAPFAWGTHIMAQCPLSLDPDGTCRFGVDLAEIPAGSSSVEIWVREPIGGEGEILYRLTPFAIELTPEPTGTASPSRP
jgi:hypothetical protein